MSLVDSTYASFNQDCDTPAGLADGQVMVAYVQAFYTDSATCTPTDANWQLFLTLGNGLGSGSYTSFVFWKYVADASLEPAQQEFTIGGGGGDHITIISVVSDVDTGAPLQVTWQSDNVATGDSTFSLGALAVSSPATEFVFGADFGGGNALWEDFTYITMGALTGYQPAPIGPREMASWYLEPATGAAINATRGWADWCGGIIRVATQAPAAGSNSEALFMGNPTLLF